MADINDMFSSTNGNEAPKIEPITVDVLVGEGQKYKTPDDLATAYVHADATIASLKAKEAEREARLAVLEEIALKQKPNEAPQNPNPEPKAPNPPVADGNGTREKDISAQIREEISNFSEEKRKTDNINEVAVKTTQFYGSADKAKQAVIEKAAAMGVTPEWLMDAAARSPQAFYQIMEVNPEQRSNSTPNADANELNIRGNAKGGQKNMAYWEEIRKTKPKLYYSRDAQAQMFANRRELGEAFFT